MSLFKRIQSFPGAQGLLLCCQLEEASGHKSTASEFGQHLESFKADPSSAEIPDENEAPLPLDFSPGRPWAEKSANPCLGF